MARVQEAHLTTSDYGDVGRCIATISLEGIFQKGSQILLTHPSSPHGLCERPARGLTGLPHIGDFRIAFEYSDVVDDRFQGCHLA